jgi:nitrite reductase/ring-hydroxylating ferredoxin subunit
MEGTLATPPNRGPEVMALLGRLAEIARMDIKAATGLPARLYTSRAFHAAEQTALFENGWLCVGRSDDEPAPGDYLVSDIGNVSLATVRGQDGVVRNLANTCLHRMTRLLSGKGNCRGRIVCPYHAWTYFDDGRLDIAPQMDKAVEFDASCGSGLRTGSCGRTSSSPMNPTIAPVMSDAPDQAYGRPVPRGRLPQGAGPRHGERGELEADP